MKYNNYSNESSESSNFNEAGLQIARLNNSWLNCKKYRTQGDLLNWRWELEVIWSELSTDARRLNNNSDKDDYELIIAALDKMINLCASHKDAKSLYAYLDKKEKRLRWLQDEAGKGGSYKDGTEDLD